MFRTASPCQWPECRIPQAEHNRLPYHRFVHALCDKWPLLQHLDNFMNEPLHRTFPREGPKARIAVLDFCDTGITSQGTFDQADKFSTFLDQVQRKGSTRLFLVEDLSRDIVEILGSRFDVDPAFFAWHVGGMGWFSRRSSPSTVPGSQSSSREQSFVKFRYLEARPVLGRYDGQPVERYPCLDSNVLRKVSIMKLASLQHAIGMARRQITMWMNPVGGNWIGLT
jgi:hypothetical protein